MNWKCKFAGTVSITLHINNLPPPPAKKKNNNNR